MRLVVFKSKIALHFEEILCKWKFLMECKHDGIEHLTRNFPIDGIILVIVDSILAFEYCVKENVNLILLFYTFVVILVFLVIGPFKNIILAHGRGSSARTVHVHW
jgi:hypothetical protein